MVRQRARIRFRKQGDLRLIGHRDLVRLLERLFRRAGLRLAMSEGFHPKPRMSFPSALALGIEGLDEVMELELAEPATAEALHAQLTRHAVPGLGFAAVEILPPGTRKAQLRSTTYQLPVPDDRRAAADRAVRLLGESSGSATETLNSQADFVRQSLDEIRLEEGFVRFRLRAGRQRSAGPRDVLAALGLDDAERLGACLTRTAVELQSCAGPMPAP
jgi:radical SAM-linked protein